MRKTVQGIGLAVALGCGLGLAGAAQAQERPFYFGVKLGQMKADIDALDNTTNAGVLIGVPFISDGTMSAALEGEFTTTVSKGDAHIFGNRGEWDIDTVALYGALRTAGPFYFKAKAGYLSEDVSISVPGIKASGTDSGFSYGIGAGWRLTGGSRLEVEYTLIESDVNFLSLGFIF